jgi:hypothetical protein
VHAPAKPAIGGRDNAFAADLVGEPDDAFRHQFGVLDHVGRVTDDAGQDQLAVRQFDVLPDSLFVLVADVACLK